ncbi:MAG: DNA topoisomerase VI subunit B [Planctomycetota bacterium]|nr:DNA topoisomerase VI subunit B [Planctomycetota bacterium]
MKPKARVTAETMASQQRDISVSEFFAKNRHLLGFDNPRKALLTMVKEAVDNSLDACEEAGILPEIIVVIEDLADAKGPGDAKPASKASDASNAEGQGKKGKPSASSRYRVTVVDNGPGIVRRQVENIFGRLLYGSKFHRLKMSRGQQGIGISAAGMYGLLTTGRPMVIHTRPDAKKPAHHIELAMNTKTNRAEVTTDDETTDFPPARLREVTKGTRAASFMPESVFVTGTSVAIELEGRYQKGRGSVDEFLELTAIANPHARITFVPPSKVSADEEDETLLLRGRGATNTSTGGDKVATPATAHANATAQPKPGGELDLSLQTQERDGVIEHPRGVEQLPPETKEIQPHPRGVELGEFLQMLKQFEADTKGSGTVYTFLQERFCRVSSATASQMCGAVRISSRAKAGDVEPAQAEALFRQLQEAKLPPPPTDCLAPIGVRQLLAGMLKGVKAEFYAASSREAEVYRGRPFQIEAAIAFGGELPSDDSARVIRFANRVPLLFQQSACSSFKAAVETTWKNYGLQQPRGSLPVGPLVVMIHVASVWVPFTSESKEAIADYDEIRKEMKLALMECGRKLNTYINKRAKMRREAERRDVFQKYIGEIAKACNAITGVETERLYAALLEQAKQKTAIADAQLNEDGRVVKEDDELAQAEGVVVVESRGTGKPGGLASPAAGSAASGAPVPAPTAAPTTAPGAMKATSPAKSGSTRPQAHAAKPEPAKPEAAKPAQSAVSGASPSARRSDVKPANAKPAVANPANAAPADAKPAKPRMRLDLTGKMKRVDEPGLF